MPESSQILSVIIVSFNTKELTIQSLYSLVQDLLHSSLKKTSEIIVIDNNSADGSIGALHTFKKQSDIPVTLILNTDNKGFGAANNQGIEAAQGKYLFFLNSDTVVQPGALEKMVAVFSQTPDSSTAETRSHHGQIDHLGILAPTLLNVDGSIQAQGGSSPSLGAIFAQMSFLDDIPLIGKLFPSTQHTGKRAEVPKAEMLTAIDWVSGAAIMIKKEMFEEVGSFDEHIFMYGEDVELCLRAKNHLWDVAIDNQAFITHLQSQSSSSQNAITGELQGYIYIWSKHKPNWQLPLLKTILKMGILLRIFLYSLLGKKEKAALYKKSYATLFHQ